MKRSKPMNIVKTVRSQFVRVNNEFSSYTFRGGACHGSVFGPNLFIDSSVQEKLLVEDKSLMLR